MKKVFALIISIIVVAVLFVGCNSETPTVDTPDESKSFAQTKIEEAGFRTAKSDNTLPTMENIPESARKLALNTANMSDSIAILELISWDDDRRVEKFLDEHPELCPQLALLIDEACNGGYITNASPESIRAIDEFGKKYGIWT